MNAHFERGNLLLNQHRYPQAEREFRLALAEEPDAPHAHALLGMVLRMMDRHEEALAEANLAVGLAPDAAYCHYSRAVTLVAMDRHREAEAAVAEAIRLDPEDADYHALRAQILFQRSRWTEALAAADEGLAIDPRNVDCVNFRGMTLSKLGRRDEATQTLQGALEMEPENAMAHAAQGWQCLEQRNPQQALEHFREALRLQPDYEYARAGLVEALKARHLLYRVMLSYFLWMARLSPRARWAVIIGLFVGNWMMGPLKKAVPALAPVLLPLGVLYVVFCILTWVAVPAFNLLLRTSRFGRYALSKEQIRASNLFGAFLAAAAGLGIVGLVLVSMPVLALGVWFGLMVVPVALAMDVTKSGKRPVALGAAALLGFIGLVAWALSVQAGNLGGAGRTLDLFLLGWILFPWLTNSLE